MPTDTEILDWLQHNLHRIVMRDIDTATGSRQQMVAFLRRDRRDHLEPDSGWFADLRACVRTALTLESAPASHTSRVCQLCGLPMPPGEEHFNYHGYSGPCPKPAWAVTPPRGRG